MDRNISIVRSNTYSYSSGKSVNLERFFQPEKHNSSVEEEATGKYTQTCWCSKNKNLLITSREDSPVCISFIIQSSLCWTHMCTYNMQYTRPDKLASKCTRLTGSKSDQRAYQHQNLNEQYSASLLQMLNSQIHQAYLDLIFMMLYILISSDWKKKRKSVFSRAITCVSGSDNILKFYGFLLSQWAETILVPLNF